MTSNFDYTVFEDNGGGLQLFIFRRGESSPSFGFDGFEYEQGSLVATLTSLDNGDTDRDIRHYDGRIANLQDQWHYITTSKPGYAVIAESNIAGPVLYPERMGRAALYEFGITKV